MADVTFTITCTMNERWASDFMSFLNYMEHCGNIGHSALIGFYADGDGDFRPKFQADNIRLILKDGRILNKYDNTSLPEKIFDAG